MEADVLSFLKGQIALIKTEEDKQRVLKIMEEAARNLLPTDFEGMEWILDQTKEIEGTKYD